MEGDLKNIMIIEGVSYGLLLSGVIYQGPAVPFDKVHTVLQPDQYLPRKGSPPYAEYRVSHIDTCTSEELVDITQKTYRSLDPAAQDAGKPSEPVRVSLDALTIILAMHDKSMAAKPAR